MNDLEDSETRQVDVSSAMSRGDNTLTLIAQGRTDGTATILIADNRPRVDESCWPGAHSRQQIDAQTVALAKPYRLRDLQLAIAAAELEPSITGQSGAETKTPHAVAEPNQAAARFVHDLADPPGVILRMTDLLSRPSLG